jgi:hypothetical protein
MANMNLNSATPHNKPKWADATRSQLLKWLKEYDPLQDHYYAAWHNLFGPEYPVQAKVVCYCTREITSNLARFVLHESPRQVEYKNRTEEICKCWPKDIAEVASPGHDDPAQRKIPKKACDAVQSLVDEHQSNGENKRKGVTKTFQTLAPEMHPRRRAELTDLWMKLDKDLNSALHTNPGNTGQLDLKDARDLVSDMEKILLELNGKPSITSILETIDAVLRDANARRS